MLEFYEHIVDCQPADPTCAAVDVTLSPAQLEIRARLEARQLAEEEVARRKRDALIRLKEAALKDPQLADLLLVLAGEQ